MTFSLGASHAPRWMNCPGAPRMISRAALLDQPDANRDAGSDAHWVAESVLKNVAAGTPDAPRAYVGQVGPNGTYIDTNMAIAVGYYVQDVLSAARMTDAAEGPLPSLQVEKYYDMSWLAPGVKAILDASVYDAYSKTVTLWDYKHGADPRDPEYDWQMVGCALALAQEHPDANKFDIRIVQPNAWQGDVVKSWIIEPEVLRPLGIQMRQVATQAQTDSAPIVAGLHCKRCAVRACCPAFKAYTERLVEVVGCFTAEPQHLQPDELSRELDMLDAAKKAVKARKEAQDVYAFHAADKQGAAIPGYKLADKVAHRKIGDPTAFRQFANMMGYTDTMIMSEPKLLSPSQLENVGVDKALIEQFATRDDKGKQLVPLSNKKPATTSWLIETFSKVKG